MVLLMDNLMQEKRNSLQKNTFKCGYVMLLTDRQNVMSASSLVKHNSSMMSHKIQIAMISSKTVHRKRETHPSPIVPKDLLI